MTNNYADDDSVMAQKVYMEEKDASYARQVEQELRDEELARQLAEAEERALQAEQRTQGPPPRRAWTTRRACSYCIPLIIVVVGVVALLYAMQRDDSGGSTKLPNFGNPQFWEDEDPWEGLAPNEVVKWRNGGSGGLRLELLDAMEPKWESIFLTAVDEWDNGTPDALDLSTSKVPYDMECEPVDNRFKVCNGNYGDTQWRGINQVLIQNGFIVSTTSKMNEYYLASANQDQRQYTMCHELGHGFGLPHSDEDFFNKDLGNCMDYTSNPENNKSPDTTNYEFLEDLYGTLPARIRGLRSLEKLTVVEQQDSAHTSLTKNSIPDDVRSRLQEIVPRLENRSDGNAEEDGWRLLHRSEHREAHSFELGDGWTVQMHKLLVAPKGDL
jgi:hypothetical protein